MATRQEYTSCVGQGMKGKKLSREERQLEFCVVSKLCSQKTSNREEAIRLCNLPKEPKLEKTRVTRKKAGFNEKDTLKLARCMVNKMDMERIPDEVSLANALLECRD